MDVLAVPTFPPTSVTSMDTGSSATLPSVTSAWYGGGRLVCVPVMRSGIDLGTRGDVMANETDWVEQRHIESLQYEKDKLTVTYSKSSGGGMLSYTEEFPWTGEYPPQWLKDAAGDFFGAVHEAVLGKVALTQETPCRRCTGACCRNWSGGIRVIPEDVERMTQGGVDARDCVDLWDDKTWDEKWAPSIDGSIGMMKMVPWLGLDPNKKETACINLGKDGCRIYEHRPFVCREFSGLACAMVEEDPQKVAGLVQLRVKQ